MASYPEFGALTTAVEVANAFSDEIRGKTMLITGISPNSLGEALAVTLSAHSPKALILASRTPSKLSLVATKIRNAFPGTRIEEVLLDLASQASVRKAATEISSIVSNGNLDILFNNAGINISERRMTEEGIEMQFGTNHVGPFLLTNLLMPLLLRGAGRVVNTSSEAHRISPVRFSDWNLELGMEVPEDEMPRRGMPEGILRGNGGYERAIAYGQSKTANILFAVGLNSRVAKRGVRSFAVNPGTIMTDLARDFDEKVLQDLTSTTDTWKTADQGVATLVVAAFDPKLAVQDGIYLDDCQIRRPSKWAFDRQKAERLWTMSENLVGEKFSYGGKSRL